MTHLNEGVLSATIRAALLEYDNQRAAGASEAELARNFEQTVRASWPFVREWRFLCQRCFDFGLEMGRCPGDATCGRPKEHLAHDFGTPCWCSAGNRFKVTEKTPDDAIAAAARTPKRQPTRFGR